MTEDQLLGFILTQGFWAFLICLAINVGCDSIARAIRSLKDKP